MTGLQLVLFTLVLIGLLSGYWFAIHRELIKRTPDITWARNISIISILLYVGLFVAYFPAIN